MIKRSILKVISSDKKYLEGLFFPDSYYFYKNTSDIEILQNSHSVLKESFNLHGIIVLQNYLTKICMKH